jgi:hypothetical protein
VVKVIVDTDAVRARALAREKLAIYWSLPNYVTNLHTLGFDDADVADGGSAGVIGFRRGSQVLKSPTTDTARAFGAHGKAHAGDTVDCHHVGAEVRRQFEMPAFVEQVQVEIAELWSEGIRILGFLHRVRPRDAQQVRLGAAHLTGEQARWRSRR